MLRARALDQQQGLAAVAPVAHQQLGLVPQAHPAARLAHRGRDVRDADEVRGDPPGGPIAQQSHDLQIQHDRQVLDRGGELLLVHGCEVVLAAHGLVHCGGDLRQDAVHVAAAQLHELHTAGVELGRLGAAQRRAGQVHAPGRTLGPALEAQGLEAVRDAARVPGLVHERRLGEAAGDHAAALLPVQGHRAEQLLLAHGPPALGGPGGQRLEAGVICELGGPEEQGRRAQTLLEGVVGVHGRASPRGPFLVADQDQVDAPRVIRGAVEPAADRLLHDRHVQVGRVQLPGQVDELLQLRLRPHDVDAKSLAHGVLSLWPARSGSGDGGGVGVFPPPVGGGRLAGSYGMRERPRS